MKAYSGIKHQMAPTKGGRRLWMATKKAAGWAQRHVDPARPWLLHKLGRVDIALLVRAEQAPNPDSRVALTGERDATGVPRVALDWRLSEIDVRSVAVLADALGGEFERLGLGKVEPAAWLESGRWRTDPLISSHPIGGYHHMGTTRMGADPKASVTDADGRVHGIPNLWVAGSSLFPTGSWANPTLTIVALALRTAERISQGLAR
jgi:choline dehydrogenase-like flavoprotein